MKKSKDLRKNLAIRELFDTLDAKQNNQKKVVAIAGKINTKKTRLLNAIYEYKKNLDLVIEDKNLTYFEKTIKENSLTSKASKENKKSIFSQLPTDQTKATYRNISSVSAEHFVEDIGWVLRENLVLENAYEWKHFKFIGKIYNKFLIRRILKKIDSLETNWKKSMSSNKTKMIFPVLTTISTIGTTIGVPVLSVGLFRQDEIIQTISWGGYIGILAFCAILIGVGIIAVIVYLFSVIFVNKTDYIVQNLSDGYIKLISKYFLLPSQDESKTKWVKNKIRIKKSCNLFYNEISYSDSHFEEYMNYLMILHALNNNIVFTLNVNDKFQFKQIFSSKWGSSNNYMIFDVESYKIGFANNSLVSFLLNELSKTLDFDTNNLYRKNKNFSSIINTFCEMSNHNLQLLEFLNTSKTLFKNNFSNLFNNNKGSINYIFDLFSLIAFNSLNSFDFVKLVEKIQSEFELVDEICETYNSLKIKDILISNWKTYGVQSLTANLNTMYSKKDFFSTTSTLPTSRNNDFIKQENEIVNYFNNKKFEKSSNRKIKNSTFEMLNKDGDDAIIFTINFENQDFDIFSEIKKIKEKCMKEDVLYIAINLGDSFIAFQQIDGKYQVVSNS